MNPHIQPSEVVETFIAAFEAKDAAALGAVFSADAIFINVFGERKVGADAIARAHEQMFSAALVGAKITHSGIEYTSLGEDVVLCLEQWRSELLPEATEATTKPSTGINAIILHRQNNGWKIAFKMNVKDSPPPWGPA